jgi:hypothetical protein
MDLAIYFQVNADSSDDIDYKYQAGITRWIYVGFQGKTKSSDFKYQVKIAKWIYLLVSRSKLMAVTSLGDDSTGSCFRRR